MPIVYVAKKVEDNVLCVIITPVIMLPSAAPKTPEANPLGILPKAPNALSHQVGTYAYGQAQGGQAMA